MLERAFRRTYGLEMKDVFADEDLAISAYRPAVSELIPELTRIAWRDERDEIAKRMPGIVEEQFVFRMTRADYEREFGSQYRTPGFLVRFLGVVYKRLPKVGPLRPLKFETPTPEVERLFVDSFKETKERFGELRKALDEGWLNLAKTDFDGPAKARLKPDTTGALYIGSVRL